MNLHFPKSVRRLIHAADCPDEQRLAEYADRQLIGDERHAIEHHLVRCDRCVEHIAFLAAGVPEQLEQVPDAVLSKALALAKARHRVTFPTWKLAGVGAFALLLVTLLGWRLMEHKSTGKPGELQRTHEPALVVAQNPLSNPMESPEHDEFRGDPGMESQFRSPAPGEVVDAKKLVFRWKPVNNVQFYEVELVSEDGSILWQDKTQSSSIRLPASVHLTEKKTYFVRLRVHTLRGSIDQAGVVEFKAR